MRAPDLNRALVLEHPQRIADGSGGFATVWQTLGTLWGAIRPGAGRETARDEMSLSRVPMRIVVRAAPMGAPSRPQAGQRFRAGARLFLIRAVTEYDAQARYLTCHVEEEVAA